MRKLIGFALAGCLIVTAEARPVSSDEAAHAARTYLTRNAPLLEGAELTIGEVVPFCAADDASPLFYKVAVSARGVAVIAADTRVAPILAVMPTTPLDAIPSLAIDWFVEGVQSALQEEADTTAAEADWQRLLPSSTPGARLMFAATAPGEMKVYHLDRRWTSGYFNHWNQNGVYNTYTPNRAVAGCLAVAGAAVMQYYGLERMPLLTKRCTYGVNQEERYLTTTGMTYDWVSLPDGMTTFSYTAEQKDFFAHVVSDAGILCKMGYALKYGGSGAAVQTLANAMRTDLANLGFRNVRCFNGTGTSAADAAKCIGSFLRAGSPVLLGVSNPGNHAVVAVGYAVDADKIPKIRVFLGYGGGGDGWYAVPTINAGAGYSQVNDFIAFFGDDVLPVCGVVTDTNGKARAGVPVSVTIGAHGGLPTPVSRTAITGLHGQYAVLLPIDALIRNTETTMVTTETYDEKEGKWESSTAVYEKFDVTCAGSTKVGHYDGFFLQENGNGSLDFLRDSLNDSVNFTINDFDTFGLDIVTTLDELIEANSSKPVIAIAGGGDLNEAAVLNYLSANHDDFTDYTIFLSSVYTPATSGLAAAPATPLTVGKYERADFIQNGFSAMPINITHTADNLAAFFTSTATCRNYELCSVLFDKPLGTGDKIWLYSGEFLRITNITVKVSTAEIPEGRLLENPFSAQDLRLSIDPASTLPGGYQFDPDTWSIGFPGDYNSVKTNPARTNVCYTLCLRADSTSQGRDTLSVTNSLEFPGVQTIDQASTDYAGMPKYWLLDRIDNLMDNHRDTLTASEIAVFSYYNEDNRSKSPDWFAQEDTDGDGLANWEEYLLGTDPCKADDLSEVKPKITKFVVVPNSIPYYEIEPHLPVRDYILEGVTDPADMFDDSKWDTAKPEHRFFRVVIKMFNNTTYD